MECKKEKNLDHCSCSALGCSNRGVCCDCVRYHRELGEIPGCFFSEAGEKSYDRSISNFTKNHR